MSGVHSASCAEAIMVTFSLRFKKYDVTFRFGMCQVQNAIDQAAGSRSRENGQSL